MARVSKLCKISLVGNTNIQTKNWRDTISGRGQNCKTNFLENYESYSPETWCERMNDVSENFCQKWARSIKWAWHLPYIVNF